MNKVVWLLDSSIPLPYGYRIGLDPLLGLIPGIGDSLGAFFGCYVVLEALLASLPPSVIARMILNLAVDLCLGIIPFFGDLSDFVIKANRKNGALLNAYIRNPVRTKRRSRLVVAIVFSLLLFGFGLLAYGVFVLARFLWLSLWGLVQHSSW